MNRIKAIVLLLFFTALHAHASTQVEIEHLINYVASTKCEYERNGDMYNGEQAVKHINRKYHYFADDIKTAEDFIKYSATKSELSGKYYKLHCPGEEMLNSEDWLLNELKRYRAASDSSKAE